MCKPFIAAAGVLVGYEARNADSVHTFYGGPRGAGAVFSRFYGIFDGFEGLLSLLRVLGVL